MLSGCQTHVNPKAPIFDDLGVINDLRNLLIDQLDIVHAAQNKTLTYLPMSQ